MSITKCLIAINNSPSKANNGKSKPEKDRIGNYLDYQRFGVNFSKPEYLISSYSKLAKPATQIFKQGALFRTWFY